MRRCARQDCIAPAAKGRDGEVEFSVCDRHLAELEHELDQLARLRKALVSEGTHPAFVERVMLVSLG